MKLNKSEIMKNAWIYIKLQGVSKSEGLKKAWAFEKSKGVQPIAADKGDIQKSNLSHELSVDSCWHLSWEEVKEYLSKLDRRTKTFWSLAHLFYKRGKFSTHKYEYNALYHAVPK